MKRKKAYTVLAETFSIFNTFLKLTPSEIYVRVAKLLPRYFEYTVVLGSDLTAPDALLIFSVTSKFELGDTILKYRR